MKTNKNRRPLGGCKSFGSGVWISDSEIQRSREKCASDVRRLRAAGKDAMARRYDQLDATIAMLDRKVAEIKACTPIQYDDPIHFRISEMSYRLMLESLPIRVHFMYRRSRVFRTAEDFERVFGRLYVCLKEPFCFAKI